MKEKQLIKKRKRKFIFQLVLIGLAIVSVLTGVFFLMLKYSSMRTQEKAEQQKAQQEQSMSSQMLVYQYEYTGLDNLNFITTVDEENLLKSAFESYALSSFSYGEFTTVEIQSKTEESGTQVTFYCNLDDEAESVVMGIYDVSLKSYTYSYYKQLNPAESELDIDNNNESNINGTEEVPNLDVPDGDDDVTAPANAVPLSLKGTGSLELDASKLEKLEKELIDFLSEKTEFRRELTVENDSIVKSDDTLSFKCVFDTARSDGKNVTVGYKKQDNSFEFIME